MIRAATVADIPALAKMGADFHRKSRLHEFEYIEADCAASLTNLFALPAFMCFVFERPPIAPEMEYVVVGAIAGITCPVYFNHAHASGEELFWWVDDQAPQMAGIRLLEALEGEARARGCASWQMKAIERLGGDRLARVYERRGYDRFENSYIKTFAAS